MNRSDYIEIENQYRKFKAELFAKANESSAVRGIISACGLTDEYEASKVSPGMIDIFLSRSRR